MQCIIDLIDREELILRITLFGMASPASVHYRGRHMMPCGTQVIMSTGKLSLPESSCIVKSGDRQVPETGIVSSSPSSPEIGKCRRPASSSFIHRQVRRPASYHYRRPAPSPSRNRSFIVKSSQVVADHHASSGYRQVFTTGDRVIHRHHQVRKSPGPRYTQVRRQVVTTGTQVNHEVNT